MKVIVAVALLALMLVYMARAAPPAPTRVQVTAKEFTYVVSRHSVHAGRAIVELVNFGEDPHDLKLQRIGGGRIWKTPDVLPGAYFDVEVTLVKGRYRLWCGIADHKERGMHALLVVT